MTFSISGFPWLCCCPPRKARTADCGSVERACCCRSSRTTVVAVPPLPRPRGEDIRVGDEPNIVNCVVQVISAVGIEIFQRAFDWSMSQKKKKCCVEIREVVSLSYSFTVTIKSEEKCLLPHATNLFAIYAIFSFCLR